MYVQEELRTTPLPFFPSPYVPLFPHRYNRYGSSCRTDSSGNFPRRYQPLCPRPLVPYLPQL